MELPDIRKPHLTLYKTNSVNGTIIAMNLLNGKVKWQYATKFPPRVSPLVTNKIVIAGYIPFADKTKTTSNHAKATSFPE